MFALLLDIVEFFARPTFWLDAVIGVVAWHFLSQKATPGALNKVAAWKVQFETAKSKARETLAYLEADAKATGAALVTDAKTAQSAQSAQTAQAVEQAIAQLKNEPPVVAPVVDAPSPAAPSSPEASVAPAPVGAPLVASLNDQTTVLPVAPPVAPLVPLASVSGTLLSVDPAKAAAAALAASGSLAPVGAPNS